MSITDLKSWIYTINWTSYGAAVAQWVGDLGWKSEGRDWAFGDSSISDSISKSKDQNKDLSV